MLYKYVGAQTGPGTLQLLKYYCEQYTLKVSEPTSFNDPFEFKIALDLDADEDTMRKRFIAENAGDSEKEYEDWRRRHTQQAKWWITQETRKGLLSRFGVFCASAVGDNHLMWSHYAENHTGFCVGLDESQLSGLKGLMGQGFVEYQDTAPSFRYYFESPELFQNRVFGCKSTVWSYEKEFRFVFDQSGLLEFPPSALKEVIIGCRADMPLRKFAHEQCVGSTSVQFFQMCEDFQEYKLLKRLVEKNTWLMSSFF